MSAFNKYIGRPYIEGQQDCYAIVRDYYRDVWGIRLPNFARPNRFWEDPNLDLYSMYKDVGFKPVIDEQPQIGDAFLMQIMTPVNSHAVIYVEDNTILHHMVNQPSTLEPFRPRWSKRVNVHLRHPEVHIPKEKSRVFFHEVADVDALRDPEVQERIERLLGSREGEVRGDNP